MVKIFLNDMRNGTKGNVVKFIVAVLFALAVCMYLNRRVETAGMIKSVKLPGSSGSDYVLYLLGGMPGLKEGQEKAFEVPFIWMAVQMLVCGSVYRYPVRDLHGRGMMLLLQNGSRTKWWLGKCIWAVMQVVFIYACLGAGVLLAASGNVDGGDVIHAEIFQVLENVNLLENLKIKASMVFCPVLYSIAVTLVQINLSLLTGAVLSMVFVVSYHVLSSYVLSEWVFGNISMLYRMENVAVGGQNPAAGIAGCTAAALISLIFGTCYFKHLDIMKK